ncbi:hypothetical protein CHRY9390_00991 [Chryseobacterium aquaeductus]|uniref:Uncharacterized protein n=1 Tax=Chryseobacterium aquaeductus TaxID=2675056 RepID=A0A9N8QRT3_9FLAO|nr:hypothetical protein [Chryseobacterium aquaeductus]CAA7330329.1 hypothetical protein CHRY9390_00991 [Chryseobacterium potabilaquae]CAD7802875.1 hypothetical protein CHRY9390_00991 [Chryseobacterium aquaeductus]
MAVLFYQIGIFIAIQVASMFGKNSRNTAIVLISIFTILQVFVSWLLILQFITILVSYWISNEWFFGEEKNKKPVKKLKKISYSFRDENGGRGIMEIDLDDPNLDPKIKSKALLQKEIRETSIENYRNDTEYKKALDDVMKKMTGK